MFSLVILTLKATKRLAIRTIIMPSEIEKIKGLSPQNIL